MFGFSGGVIVEVIFMLKRLEKVEIGGKFMWMIIL